MIRPTVSTLIALSTWTLFAQSTQPVQRPPRDTPAQQKEVPSPGGQISGRVVTTDNGRPVKRARVAVSARELPEGRATLTDDAGHYELTELPAGRYTLTVSKAGFISLSYGQRRPLQSGTPLQLADGQQLKGIDFQLPRGGAIAGHVYDEDGDPLPGAMVRALRYQYLQGERRLVAVGNAQSDDKGQFRIWDLLPGDYYVTAVARNFNFFAGRGGFGGRGGFASTGSSADEQTGYAPTFYPGVGSVSEARPIRLGVSQEALDVNFGIQLVRTARVSGTVTNADGGPAWNGSVNLTPEGTPMGAAGGGGPLGTNYGSRINWDGTFMIVNVPPGRYTLRARSGDNDSPEYATQPLSVAVGDVSNVGVTLSAGATISGTVMFQGTLVGDSSQVRVTAPAADQASFGLNPQSRVDKDGHFSLGGIPAGSHYIRSNGGPRGWMLKSVQVGGSETIDAPIDLRSGQTLSNVTLVFTDKISEIDGTITNDSGTPVPDFTILAFPTDPALWRPQSRHIVTARPDQNGAFQLRGLPPGEYFVAPIDPAEQGEWFEPTFLDQHRQGAVRVTLGEGDVKTQDVKVPR